MRPAGWVLAALWLADSAGAHVVYGTASLAHLVSRAELVVHARVVKARDLFEIAPLLRRPAVRVSTVAVLKGRAPEGALRFARHGHGVFDYEDGDEVLLFLEPIERRPELAVLAFPGEARFVSVQEHDPKFQLTAENRERRLSAVRTYVGLTHSANARERRATLLALDRDLLQSGDPRLVTSAVVDLVELGDAAFSGPDDLARWETLLGNSSVALGARAGLLALLQRRGLPDAAAHWLALLRDARGRERSAVIRAAGAHPSAVVSDALVAMLADPDMLVAAEAAVALGSAGHRGTEAALAAAAQRGPRRLSMAAIRGLGGIASQEARARLGGIAAGHPDSSIRRRARAELYRLRGDSPRATATTAPSPSD